VGCNTNKNIQRNNTVTSASTNAINRQEMQNYYDTGTTLLNNKDYNGAINQFFKAELYDRNKSLVFTAYTHMLRGIDHFDNGRIQEAIVDFNSAIQGMSFVNYGNTVTSMQQYRNSLYVWGLEYGYNLFPINYNSYLYRARAYVNIENFNNAISDYSVLAEKSPETEVFIERGDIYFKLEKYELALDDYNEALKLSPDSNSLKNKITNVSTLIRQRNNSNTQNIISRDNRFDLNDTINRLNEFIGKSPPSSSSRVRIGEYTQSLGEAGISVAYIDVVIIYRVRNDIIVSSTIQFIDNARNPSYQRIAWVIQELLPVADLLGSPNSLTNSIARWNRRNITYEMDQRPLESTDGKYFCEFRAILN
jgi:tetratricopeptide (TPR) repeat protein